MFEIAEVLGNAIGKKVEYRPQSMEQFEKDFGPTRAGFFEYLANGFYARCSPDFYNLTGRKPTSYAEYLANKGAAGETGLEEWGWLKDAWNKHVKPHVDKAVGAAKEHVQKAVSGKAALAEEGDADVEEWDWLKKAWNKHVKPHVLYNLV